MFKLDEPLRDYHRASIRMTHKQKPSQSIIIPFTARTNARYTLFSPSSPADAQLRPGSAAISPGGIGANAGLSPRRPTDGRTAGAPPPRERPSARPSLPAAGTEPHRGRRHRRCPRAREEPGRTGHGARKGKKGAVPRRTSRTRPRSPAPVRARRPRASAASARRPGAGPRPLRHSPPPPPPSSSMLGPRAARSATAAAQGGPGLSSSRRSLPPSPPRSLAPALPTRRRLTPAAAAGSAQPPAPLM